MEKAKAEQAEKERIEKEQAEAERKRLADELAKKEAEEKARIEAEERMIKAEEEKAKALALAPDKEKLTVWLNGFKMPDFPSISNEQSFSIAKDIEAKFRSFHQWASFITSPLIKQDELELSPAEPE